MIAANFQNAHADFTRPFLVEELTEYPDWGWNLKLQIDEIAMYAHRRKWQLTSNLNLEGFITQIRKRSVEPSAATQFPQRLDGDIVEQIDLFIDCDAGTQSIPSVQLNGCMIGGANGPGTPNANPGRRTSGNMTILSGFIIVGLFSVPMLPRRSIALSG
jgi:hypothetical protein